MSNRPEPFVERHPHGYPWRTRFPDARRIAGFEGGAVYAADSEAACWLIKDEGTMADFLHTDEDADILAQLVTLQRYPDCASRDAAAEELRRSAERSRSA